MSELLFLAHRVPFPPDRGDKIRGFHILRHLAARHRVHLVAFADEIADRHPPAAFSDPLASCTIIPRTKANAIAGIQALASRRPISLAAFDHPAMHEAIARTLAEHPIAAVHCYSGQMAQYLPRRLPAVMDFADVDSAKFEQLATGSRQPIAWLLRREARLLAAFERGVARAVTASLFVTDAEAALFRERGGEGRVLAVENGIDAVFFGPGAAFAPVDAAPPLIVFTGQMDYRPNVDAVTAFVRDTLPRVQATHPDARFAIVGRAPTAAVRALAGRSVVVTGAVDDIRGWLAAATVCVAPLAVARGIQNKVLEAMAMARPVVASEAAAEGIDHGGTILVAADADAQAGAIAALLDDPAAAARQGQAARARVLARYDWAARLAALDSLTR
ncbi:MAG TPA: TIGR03087 family PEP-CTERM/XrtA system glycosyltransferase [Sphingomonas sp.]|nr:TIGR03087 family PEP-CTERM/XrtA system glycosyltransferase [Sphingomonas sp.]